MRRRRVIRMYKNLEAGGGVQTRLAQLLPRLRPHFDVRVLCFHSLGALASQLADEGVPVDLVARGPKWSASTLGRYADYFRRHAPDVVHTHEYTANTMGIFAAGLARVPVRVRHLHTMLPWGREGWLRTAVRLRTDRWAARRAQATIANSRAVRDLYLDRSGLPEASCRVIYNGFDLDRFRSVGAQRRAVREGLGIAGDARVIGIVGRLARGKGQREFLQCAQRLCRTLPDARFLIVGDGPRRTDLEALARSLGLADRVTFTGRREDVPALLGAMDLFLFPSCPEEGGQIPEGFGNVVIEAQAAGLPVVAFELPMTRETLLDGTTGVVVAQGDVDAMVERSLEFLTDPRRAAAAGEAGRRFAAGFSLEACVDQTVRLYEELLS